VAVRGRWLATVAAVAAVALAAAGVAAADKWQVRLTPAGRSAARAVVLKRADLGGGWTGGFSTPDLSDATPCPSFHPKQSDLVVVGAADSKWQNAGVEVEDSIHVLRTAKMVRLDWQRTVVAPAAVACLRTGLKKALGSQASLVSFGRLAFPRLGFDSRAFRAVLDVKSGSQKVRVLLDEIVFGSGRFEVELTVVAPLAASVSVAATELRLARLLASRARP
jgi:hypothetical protein